MQAGPPVRRPSLLLRLRTVASGFFDPRNFLLNTPAKIGTIVVMKSTKERRPDVTKKAFKSAFPGTLPVMAGYLVLGVGFGILLQSKGYSFLWAGVMSLTIYAGSMQYVAVDLLSSGAAVLSAALMTLVINARHLFYGLSMLEKYRDVKGVKKLYLIFSLTDETYSLVCTARPPEDVDPTAFYFWTSLLNQCYWVAGSVLGGPLGQVPPFDPTGVDFAMTASRPAFCAGGRPPPPGGRRCLGGVPAALRAGPLHHPRHGGHCPAADAPAPAAGGGGGDMSEFAYSAVLVAVIVAVTQLTRFLPFLLFGGKKQPPKAVLYLGRVLPCAIMGMLVVYCLRNVTPLAAPYGIPELIGVVLAVVLHVWKRNTLLSIGVSTVAYMVLVQAVF